MNDLSSRIDVINDYFVKEDGIYVKRNLSKYNAELDTYKKVNCGYKGIVFAININHAIVLNTLFREENIKSDYVVSSIKDMYSGVSISNEENMEKIIKVL